MDPTGFLIFVVIAGGIILAAVLWRYLRATSQREGILSTTLVLVGFTLVSTPLWGSIVVKGPQWELSLLREKSENLAKEYVTLFEKYQNAVPQPEAIQLSPKVAELRKLRERVDEAIDATDRVTKAIELADQVLKVATDL